jgi:hypothetical protein
MSWQKMPHDRVFYQDKYKYFKTSMMHKAHLVPFSTACLSSSSRILINLPEKIYRSNKYWKCKDVKLSKAQELETTRIYAGSRCPKCQGETMDYTLNPGEEKASELYYKI